ncbi:MAG: Rrf2 family transcriptional regulator [Hylemonella sp.]|nr:Rrf2 family transcriptional regulator [Hylemonella sp.]
MRLSTQSRFAVNAMIEVALREQHGPVPLLVVGGRLGISRTYLEQLAGKLRRHGLLESTRGRTGGYTLGRGMAAISVADIVAAVDDVTVPMAPESGSTPMAQDLWHSLNQKMLEYLQSVSLAKLVAGQTAVSQRSGTEKRSTPGVFARSKPAAAKPRVANSVFDLAKVLAT